MKTAEIETPALLLDEPAMLRNMRLAKAMAEAAGIKLRPHYKTHRCAYLAKLQMEWGACGITCAKVGEAEDLAEAGIKDILIANQVTTPKKIERAVKIAKISKLTLCVDNAQNVLDLEAAASRVGATLSVYVEFEIGMQRCGVQTAEQAFALAQVIRQQPHLRFRGIQAYAGNLAHEYDDAKRLRDSAVVEKTLLKLKEYLDSRGIPVMEISGMSTGTLPLRTDLKTVYTEAQAGSYLLMDDAYAKMGLGFENALFILSTVISVKEGAFYTDAGLKTCSVDQGKPVLLGHPDIFTKLSEEHISHRLEGHAYKINDSVRYIPGHCCTNVNLFDKIHMISGDEVLRVIPVTSRGRSQ